MTRAAGLVAALAAAWAWMPVSAHAAPLPAQINFQPGAPSPVPVGWTPDIGVAWSDTAGSGWVRQDSLSAATHVPLDITPNTRDRNLEQDQTLDTLIHMQYPNNGNTSAVAIPAAWEYAVPNGNYVVTVAVGDPAVSADLENYVINVEGVRAINGYVPSGAAGSPTRHTSATVTVAVADGRLTIDASGGTNTKLDYVTITPASAAGADTTPPNAPANLAAAAGNGQVQLSWSANTESDLKGYNVFRSATATVDTSGTPLNGAPLTTPVFLDTSPTNGTTYNYAVQAVDTSGNKSAASATVSATPQASLASIEFDVNFGDQATAPPAGYYTDYGQAFGPRSGANQGAGLTYGWVVPGTHTPLSLVGNGRNRGTPSDVRLATLLHMQYTGSSGVTSPGAWEAALVNGTYTVTVSVGDASFYDSTHRLTVEGTPAISGFVPSAANPFASATVTVNVTDGRLTIDANGGTNTKIDYVTITSGGSTPPPPPPPPPSSSTTITWSTVAPAPIGLSEAGSAVVNGKLYAFGGYVDSTFVPTNQAEVYDPAANTWSSIAPMPVGLTHMGVATDGTSVYIAGGYPPNATNTAQLFATTGVWKYDTTTNTWSSMPSLPAARGGGSLVNLNGVLHYFGGSDANRADVATHWTLPLAGTAWATAAPIPVPRNHLGGVALNGKMYAVGGQQGQDAAAVYSAELDAYDPSTDRWTRFADLPSARSHIAAATFLLGSKIVAIGGETSFGTSTSQVVQYDPVSNSWTQMTALPTALNSGVGGNVNGTLYYSTGLFTRNTYKGVVSTSAPPPSSSPGDFAVNFQPDTATVPSGYLLDSGQAYGMRTGVNQGSGLTYGWVKPGTTTPVSLVGNARVRGINPDPRFDSLIHMQYTGTSGVATPGAWEMSVPNGTYEVTASVGDAGNYTDSAHTIAAEGTPLVTNFMPTPTTHFQVATRLVSVSDGRMTFDPTGGTNTKLNFATATAAVAGRPNVTSTTPASGANNVLRDAAVSAELHLPNVGFGVDASTLTSTSVRLVRLSDGTQVPATANTSGGGDVIVLQPKAALDANTEYLFQVTAGVKDLSGAAFLPYATTFTTGSATSATTNGAISFAQFPQSTSVGKQYTTVLFGPDGKLYASTLDGLIYRFPVAADGSLGTPQIIDSLQTAEGGARMLIGMAFDPSATASNLVLWVSHSAYATNDAPDWTGKITRLSGPDLGTVKDYVTGLPRSIRDHMTNSVAFGPDGALYALQGSDTAQGAPDAAWGNRPEHLLSAALLRIDVGAITTPPLDVRTDDAGSYNPFAPGAPVTIYADGIRNGYDMVWHSNGRLYVPGNGSSAGGNTPETPSPLPAACASRSDGAYTGPSVPGLTNTLTAQNDYLFRIVRGGYYGHPNPDRCEWVLYGGNPTAGADPAEVPDYPVGVAPDRNYRGFAFDFGAHYSPDGAIEYKSAAFGGALKGDILAVRYSSGDDIVALQPGGPNLDITNSLIGISGFTGFTDPIDLTEDPGGSGRLYVSEMGASRITLLTPLQASGGAIQVQNLDGEPYADRAVFNRIGTLSAPPSNGVHDTATIRIRNAGTGTLTISGLSLSSAAWQLVSPPALPATIAVGASLDVPVKFVAQGPPATGPIWNGTLTIQSNDAATPAASVQLAGYWQSVSEGGQEPTLDEIVQMFGYKTSIAFNSQQLNQNGLERAIGNEVLSPYWQRADSTQVVKIRQLAAFHSCSNFAYLDWFARGSSTLAAVVSSSAKDCQSLLPHSDGSTTSPAQGSFAPTTPFGFSVDGQESSDDKLNNATPDVTNGCPGPCGHHMRFWTVLDRSGNVVPNTYVMSMDYAGINYDYNDNVYLIRNIKPAPPSQVLYRLDVGATGNYTDGQGNVWTPDTGYFSPSTTAAEGANYAIQAINWTDDDPLYDTYRALIPNTTQSQRVLTYTLPIAAGVSKVNVKLLYAERYWTATGQRVFNVDVNGSRVSTNFDIFKYAPGANNALIIPVYHVPITSGTLTITFTASVDYGAVNAIEVDADP